MGISTALNAAVSGLTAATRMAETKSNNIANALTENYSRREVSVSANVLNGYGDGVRIHSVDRVEDVVATTSRRAMDSEFAMVTTTHEAADRIRGLLGAIGDDGALANRFTILESALVGAANEQGVKTFLDAAVARARELSTALNFISDETARIREDADAEIAASIADINDKLQKIDDLNHEISARWSQGNDNAALQDARSGLIDEVAEYFPLRVINRPRGEIALFTQEGGTLVDGIVHEFSFNASPIITHDMTYASGALSGLFVDNKEVPVNDAHALFDGGKLAALFQVRDTDAPSFNTQIDALARDLVERFQDPAVDPTLGAADAGLFTDGGLAFSAANEIGLAGRISVNALVDPREGGETWRLRDGLNAAVQGEVGNNTILRNLEATVQDRRSAAPSMDVFGALSAAGMASEITSQRATKWALEEEQVTYTGGQVAVLKEAESSRIGVDTDRELHQLLEIEKLYAANAKVISTVDGLLARLLEI